MRARVADRRGAHPDRRAALLWALLGLGCAADPKNSGGEGTDGSAEGPEPADGGGGGAGDGAADGATDEGGA
jgi:hypothetical protein